MSDTAAAVPAKRSFGERMLDGVEKAGNKVPHPVLMFVYLIAFIAVLSAILAATTSPGFGVVAVTFVAMAGVGVAEKAGMMGALIRKLVAVAPSNLITFFIVLVGVLSSVASDAGYLILIPLAAAAFLSVGRHPLAGLAAAQRYHPKAGIGTIIALMIPLRDRRDGRLDPAVRRVVAAGHPARAGLADQPVSDAAS